MTDRIERLKSDAAELNVSKGAARDGLWQVVGGLAAAVGVVMAFQLLIGRYTGYRLAELFRFRDFVHPSPLGGEGRG